MSVFMGREKTMRRAWIDLAFAAYFALLTLGSLQWLAYCLILSHTFSPTSVLGVGIDRSFLLYVNALPVSTFAFEFIEISRFKFAALLFVVIAAACVCAGLGFIDRFQPLRLVALVVCCVNIIGLIYAFVEYRKDGFVNTTVFVHFDTLLRLIFLFLYLSAVVYLFRGSQRMGPSKRSS